jgi:hypothetical protein
MRGCADDQRSCFIPIIDFPPWLNEDATRDRSNRLLDLIRDYRPKQYRSIVSLLQAIRKSRSLECGVRK